MCSARKASLGVSRRQIWNICFRRSDSPLDDHRGRNWEPATFSSIDRQPSLSERIRRHFETNSQRLALSAIRNFFQQVFFGHGVDKVAVTPDSAAPVA